MSFRFWDDTVLSKLLDGKTRSIRELIEIAGGNPKTFLKGANFSGVDLRGQDLRGLGLKQSDIVDALTDKKTLLDDDETIIEVVPKPEKISKKLYDISQAVSLVECLKALFQINKRYDAAPAILIIK